MLGSSIYQINVKKKRLMISATLIQNIPTPVVARKTRYNLYFPITPRAPISGQFTEHKRYSRASPQLAIPD